MILVTGASGKTGRAVITALVARGVAVRAFVRRTEAGAGLLTLGAREIALGSLDDESAVSRALQGCRAAYHIAPNVDAGEALYGSILLRAAARAGIEHVVYHSVLHPQIEAMPHHWAKMRVEEMIFASGLPFTILQPTAYMQNILGALPRIRSDGFHVTPYPVTTRINLVDLADVGEAAAIALTEPGHAGATYELVGTPALDQMDVAQALSRALGRRVVAQELSLDSWDSGARASGLPDHARETLAQMFRAYAQQGLVGNSNVLRWLLGRAPTSLEDMLARSLA